MKRGDTSAQVTLFVIIAIVIVAAVFAMIYWQDITKQLKEIGYPSQAKAIQSDIQSCVEETAKKSVNIISLQGGLLAPDSYYADEPFHITYWYDNGKDVSPRLSTIQSELSWMMNRLLPECVNFSAYGIEGFTAGNVSTTTTIKDAFTVFDVRWPVSVTVAGKSYAFEKFSDREDVRLGIAYNISRAIVAKQSGINVCLTCLADLGDANNVVIDLSSLEGKAVIPTIIDNQSKIFQPQPYKFRFAMRIG